MTPPQSDRTEAPLPFAFWAWAALLGCILVGMFFIGLLEALKRLK